MAGAAHDDALTPERVTERVTRETLPDGRVVAVKRAAPNAPVKREGDILRYLYKRGCPVPEVVSAGEDELVTLWCGHETLDDALQAGRPVSGAALVEAVRKVSLVFNRVAPIPPIAKDALAAQLKPWAQALPEAWTWLLDGTPPERLLDETIECAVACEPAAGSLDYTARNVLIDDSGQRVWLIDFAATGFDWTERRIAQYALGAGGGRAEGAFRSALTDDAFASEGDPTATDAHEVVLLLTAAEHLREVEAGTAHEERQTAWRNVAQRKTGLIELLRRPLAGHGPAARLRAALR